MTGNPITGVRVVVTDGQAHAVDSSDLAFRIAMAQAVRLNPRAAAAAAWVGEGGIPRAAATTRARKAWDAMYGHNARVPLLP